MSLTCQHQDNVVIERIRKGWEYVLGWYRQEEQVNKRMRKVWVAYMVIFEYLDIHNIAVR